MPDLGNDPPAVNAPHEAKMIDKDVRMNPQPHLYSGRSRRKPVNEDDLVFAILRAACGRFTLCDHLAIVGDRVNRNCAFVRVEQAAGGMKDFVENYEIAGVEGIEIGLYRV